MGWHPNQTTLGGRVTSQYWPPQNTQTAAGSSVATPVLLSSTDVTPWPHLETVVQEPTPLAIPSAGPPSTLAFLVGRRNLPNTGDLDVQIGSLGCWWAWRGQLSQPG